MLFIIHTWSTLLVVFAFLLGWIPRSMTELQLCFQHYTKRKMNWCWKEVKVKVCFAIVFQEQHLFSAVWGKLVNSLCCFTRQALVVKFVGLSSSSEAAALQHFLAFCASAKPPQNATKSERFIFTCHQCDNTQYEAVEKLDLLKKLISSKHQSAGNFTACLHCFAKF